MNFTRALLTAALIATTGSFSFAQKTNEVTNEYRSKLHLGLGFGMDYGGMGIKVEYLPIKYLGVFGSLGYNFRELGVNGGVQFRPLPDARIQPLVMAMYGYNGVINIKGDQQYLDRAGLGDVNKSYYGPSVGVGGELKVGKKDNRLYLGIWLPFRSKEFTDNYDLVKESPYVEMSNELLPVTFSIGFNWAI